MVRWKRIVLFSPTLVLLWLFYFHKTTRIQCVRFPSDDTLLKRADVWQTQETHGGTLRLLSAFLDDRQESWFGKEHALRILGAFDVVNPGNLYCQIWYDDLEVVVVESTHFRIWKSGLEKGETSYQPLVFSCQIDGARVPKYVSLVGGRCDFATNRLSVAYETGEEGAKSDFVVCTNAASFPEGDVGGRLVEWIELVTLLGASKIHFYQPNTHHNTQKVLDYYQTKNRVATTPLTSVENLPKIQEILALNDCFYKYLHKSKYVVSLNVDEVLISKDGTWSDLMMHLRDRNVAADSYLARNVYFFDHLEHDEDVPQYMHILRHVTRTGEFSPIGSYDKGFHGTDRVVAVDNHRSLWCLGWWGCENVNMGVDLAQLQHYKGDCAKELRNCEELKGRTVVDRGVWRFKEKLVARVERTLADLRTID